MSRFSDLVDYPTRIADLVDRGTREFSVASAAQAAVRRASGIDREIDRIREDINGVGRFPATVAEQAARHLEERRAWADPLAAAYSSGSLFAVEQAIEAARGVGAFSLPNELESFRRSEREVAESLMRVHDESWWRASYADALHTHQALADMLSAAAIVDRHVLDALEATLHVRIPELQSVAQAQNFLDAAGLMKLRGLRRLTAREKRERVRGMVRDNRPPRHVRKAHSVIHSHEISLRLIMAQCLEDAYGEDWAKTRLPLCGKNCDRLLDKPLVEFETPLDYADYVHYVAIMVQPDHYDDIFSEAFDSPDIIRHLFERARVLRASASHARRFTPEDMVELALVWKTIAVGLSKLTDDVVWEDG